MLWLFRLVWSLCIFPFLHMIKFVFLVKPILKFTKNIINTILFSFLLELILSQFILLSHTFVGYLIFLWMSRMIFSINNVMFGTWRSSWPIKCVIRRAKLRMHMRLLLIWCIQHLFSRWRSLFLCGSFFWIWSRISVIDDLMLQFRRSCWTIEPSSRRYLYFLILWLRPLFIFTHLFIR